MSQRRRILVIEDEMIVQLHLAQIVEELGHQLVGTAVDMDEALGLARQHRPDLVLTDIHLANGSDGVATAGLLVEEFDCAIVFITAYADQATIERTQQIGAAGYLVKPFTNAQVHAAIATALTSHARLLDQRAQTRLLDSALARFGGVPRAFAGGRDGARTRRTAPFGAGTRLMVYSHDTFGLGHLRRSLALVRTVCQRCPGVSVLLVTGSPMVHRYAMPDGVDYVKLPALQKVGAERYEARSLQIPGADVIALRSSLILQTARDYQPNVLLVDHAPAGSEGELLPTLHWLRQEGQCTRVLGLRDIVDGPDLVRKLWSKGGIYEVMETHYDHVVVYGDRAVYDPLSEYRVPATVTARASFLGYVCSGLTDAQPVDEVDRAGVSAAGARPKVFVTIGGGDGGAETVILPFLEMMQQFAGQIDFSADVVTGPFCDRSLRARMEELAVGLPVALHEFLPSTRSYLEAAEVVISTAGYNTVTDVLSLAQRSLLIPRALFRQEQTLRSRRLAELGWCSCLHPDEVTPQRLFETLQRIRQDTPLARARVAGLPLDGAAAFAEFCAGLQVAVRVPAEASEG